MDRFWGYGDRAGIRAESRSGGFGATWLGREWFDLLAHVAERSVLSSGAAMARRGAAQAISVAAGRISGRVLEYNTLYAVEMELPPLSDLAQAMLLEALASEPLIAAQVLGGSVPRELPTLDAELGVGLFPASLRDFDVACGCYRWEVPCKHTAAVWLLVAEAFDHDPWLFFTLRGLERAEMIRHLGGGAVGDNTAPPQAPLSADPATFWHGTPHAAEDDLVPPSALIAPLPPFPFWGGTRPFDAVMRDYLDQAAQYVRELGE